MDALGKLGINLGLLLANTANLLIMLLVLRLVAYEPIMKMLQTRRERIAEGINNAARAEEALASAEADKQAILDEARADAQRIVSEARSRADDAAKQIESEARQGATRIVAAAEEEASAEREQVLAGMRDQIVSLSMAAANHLIGQSLDEKKQKSLVGDFFTALPDEAKSLSGDLEVVTAVPLTDAERKKYADALGAENVSFTVDPSILGGVIVRSESEQVDASYAAQLVEMRESLG